MTHHFKLTIQERALMENTYIAPEMEVALIIEPIVKRLGYSEGIWMSAIKWCRPPSAPIKPRRKPVKLPTQFHPSRCTHLFPDAVDEGTCLWCDIGEKKDEIEFTPLQRDK